MVRLQSLLEDTCHAVLCEAIPMSHNEGIVGSRVVIDLIGSADHVEGVLKDVELIRPDESPQGTRCIVETDDGTIIDTSADRVELL